MSLINDALRKARQDAAQQEAVRRGLPTAKAPAFTPRRDLRRFGLAAVLLIALGLAAWGGAWLAGRAGEVGSPSGPDAPTARSAASNVQPAAAGDPASQPARRPTGTAPPADPPETTPSPTQGDSPPPAPAPTGSPVAASPAPPAPTPQPAPTSAQPARPEAPPDSPPPAATSQPEPTADLAAVSTPPANETYSRQATLPNGSTLRLDGLAWSETYPTAVLNGQIVGRGERVAGALVLRIERDRVVVEADGRELTIQLR